MLNFELYLKNLTNDKQETVTLPAGENIVFAYDYLGDGRKKYMFKLIEYINDLTTESALMQLLDAFDDLDNNDYSFSAKLINTELNTVSNITTIDKVSTIDLRGEMNASGTREMLEKYAFMRVFEVV